uniref:T-box domain-containing protein n=1 Tax=Salarias fasciatus TaxID=181472 RepID=A0A672I5K9_SALFA
MERNLQVTGKESDSCSNMSLSKEAICRPDGQLQHFVSPSFQADNLSADMTCSNIRVTLDNNVMWNEFYRCDTEMILTKEGSRMFPYCRFRISGLKPTQKYSLILDIQPSDDNRYRWTGKSWQAVGEAEIHIKSEPFAHPDSPALGQHWMQNPVSFFRLKLTNSLSEQKGNIILRPMHRYLPRLHVVTEKTTKDLHGSDVVTFTFPQTEFMAVLAYQNAQFAQLKVDCNPFFKGLKDTKSNKDGLSSDNEGHPIKKSLKSLLANHKLKSTKALESKSNTFQILKTLQVTEIKNHSQVPQSAAGVEGRIPILCLILNLTPHSSKMHAPVKLSVVPFLNKLRKGARLRDVISLNFEILRDLPWS